MDSQIALVDDHRLFRSGIASLIQKLSGFSIMFEASNGEELISKIQQGHKPDIILLDINMPVLDGINTATWLRTAHPEIKIIALSTMESEAAIIKMVRSGAKGYVLKDAEPAEFPRCRYSSAR